MSVLRGFRVTAALMVACAVALSAAVPATAGAVELPVAIRGTVTDGAGHPLLGVWVAVTYGDPSAPTEDGVSTNANGAYEFRLPAGTYNMSAYLDHYGIATAAGVIFDGSTPAARDFILQLYSRAFFGTVTDTAGTPLTGARVTASGPAEALPAYTDAAGTYELYLPAGDYRLSAVVVGYQVSTTPVIAFNGTSPILQNLVIKRVPLAIRGTVTDALTGAPVQSARVDVSWVDAEGVHQADWTSSSATGIYELYLESGTYDVMVSQPDRYRSAVASSVVFAGTAAVLRDFSLEPVDATHLSVSVSRKTLSRFGEAVTIGGHLRLASTVGEPLAGQTVEVWAKTTSGFRKVKDLVSSSAGDVSWRPVPSTTTTYQLRFLGSPGTLGAVTSASVTVTPRAYVGPVAAVRYATRAYALKGTLRPAHAAGTRVRIYRWKLVGRTWRAYPYVTAAVAGSTAYSLKHRFPSTGTWRLRAYHPADSGHAASWSAYSSVTVR